MTGEPVTGDRATGDRVTAGALAQLVADAEVVVCCGSGGVGKTTVAAALGMQAARAGRRAVVVTIDPARRLADALGVTGGLSNEPVRLPLDAQRDADEPATDGTDGSPTAAPGGELWALMLDAAATFDGLVVANAASPEQAERILANGFYRNVAGRLSGTQEYMAAERLHALHRDPRFDVVIVDTPPSRNALDFLDAPSTLTRFIDHPLFKMLMLPTRRGLKVLNVAAQPVLRTIGKVVGGEVLADAIAFFQAFAGMETGFRERADDVLSLLRSDACSFVLVASPRADTVGEARYFADRLRASSLAVGAVIVNRATPTFDDTPADAAAKGRSADLAAVRANLAQLRRRAEVERGHVQPLVDDTGTVPVWVPLLADDVHDQSALETIRGLLFDAVALRSGGNGR